MKIGFTQINIDPEFPVSKMFSEEKMQDVADDLHCRILVLDQGEKPWYHFSIDTIEVPREYRDRIKEVVEKYEDRKVDLVVSGTHSHFCPGLTKDKQYQQFVLQKIAEHLQSIEMKEYEKVSYRFQSEYFDKTGKSRISARPSENIFAQTLSLFGDGKRVATVLIYNSHPTTMRMGQGKFTSEYPGYVVRRLQSEYPGEFFTFMLGPAGDISSRFTRQNQNYEEIVRLGEMLVQEYKKQMDSESDTYPVGNMVYREKTLVIEREIPDTSEDWMPESISEREAETMAEAKARAANMDMNHLIPEHIFCQLILSKDFSFIFEPFEMYSSYYNFVDKEKCSLITISNGFDHYITEIGPQWLSFEVFGDTVTDDMKKKIGKLLSVWSRQEA